MQDPAQVWARPTEPLPVGRARGGFWPEVSGALALGLAVLAAAVLVFQVIAWVRGIPGPGLATVGAHLGAAVMAALAQWLADRRRGWVAVVAVFGVLVVTGATMWIFWWA